MIYNDIMISHGSFWLRYWSARRAISWRCGWKAWPAPVRPRIASTDGQAVWNQLVKLVKVVKLWVNCLKRMNSLFCFSIKKCLLLRKDYAFGKTPAETHLWNSGKWGFRPLGAYTLGGWGPQLAAGDTAKTECVKPRASKLIQMLNYAWLIHASWWLSNMSCFHPFWVHHDFWDNDPSNECSTRSNGREWESTLHLSGSLGKLGAALVVSIPVY